MAHFKRKRKKNYRYPTCHGGLRCKYDVVRSPTDNSENRYPSKSWRQPQMYDDHGRRADNFNV